MHAKSLFDESEILEENMKVNECTLESPLTNETRKILCSIATSKYTIGLKECWEKA